MRVAQILNGRAHWIFETEDMSGWPPYPDGTEPVLLDVSQQPEVKEGWLYQDGHFVPPLVVEPEAADPTPTLVELAENQLIIMAALADLYERGL